MSNFYAQYPVLGSGGGTTLTFADSIVDTAGTVTLVNDSASPGNSKYYGTNSGGTLGYFSIPNATALTFADSVVNSAGTITLVNDSVAPGNSKYYGTNSGGTLGYFSIPNATALTFSNSVVNTAGTVTLVNDSASPGNSKYYGTNSGGTLGYFSIANPTALTFADSVVNSAGTVTLVNDSASPGNTQYYGTDGSGTLGYHGFAAGTITITTFGSTPNNNGLTLSSSVLNMEPADSTHPGGVSTTTQTFAGAKTFNAKVAVVGSADAVQLQVTGNATQTTNVVDVRTSASVDLFTLDNSGKAYISTNLKIGTTTALQNALAEGLTVLNLLTSDLNTVSPASFIRTTMNQNAVSGMTRWVGCNAEVQRQNTVAASVSEAVRMAAFNGRITINFQSGQTYTSTAQDVAPFVVQSLSNTNASTLAISNYCGICVLSDTANTGTYKTALQFNSWSGATNNAFIADNQTFSGNWALNFSSTNPVQFSGSVVCSGAALSTSATDGFLYLPTCAGVPTGVPTSRTGTCAFLYDTTDNKLYVYNSAWKQVALT